MLDRIDDVMIELANFESRSSSTVSNRREWSCSRRSRTRMCHAGGMTHGEAPIMMPRATSRHDGGERQIAGAQGFGCALLEHVKAPAGQDVPEVDRPAGCGRLDDEEARRTRARLYNELAMEVGTGLDFLGRTCRASGSVGQPDGRSSAAGSGTNENTKNGSKVVPNSRDSPTSSGTESQRKNSAHASAKNSSPNWSMA